MRIEVNDGADRCEIYLAVDYRALLPSPSRYSPTLAARSWPPTSSRRSSTGAEARDFLDVMALTQRFGLDFLLTMAA